MKIRFLADADLNHDVVKGVLRREPGIDFRTAASGELRGLSDRAVLALAASEGRILVSHDRKTMPRAFAEFVMATSKQVARTCFTRSAGFRPYAQQGGRVDYRGVTSAPETSVRPIWLGNDRALLAIDGRTRI